MNRHLIGSTKLLYRWDRYNKTNIHHYIDGHAPIAMLIRTDKGQCIAAYSQGGFKPHVISNQPGLLMSLTNGVTFKNIKKSLIYDNEEVIFGNYDLRVKAG